METKIFRTNLNCGNCVATVTPFLKSDPAIENFSIDTDDDRKLLSVTGEAITIEQVRATVKKSGFKVFEEILVTDGDSESALPAKTLQTYFPLILILVYLLGFVAVNAHVSGNSSPMMLMNYFMGGFFIVFSFFKILNLKGFVDSYVSYDVVAKRVRVYAYVYPFIELLLGVAYLARFNLFYTNLVTVVVMAVSSVGVIQSVVKKEKIRCACLGTVFNLPMSTVTLVEDFLMLGMALVAVIVK